MKAIVHERFGAPRDVLHLKEIAKPAISDNEVLVRVCAASVHADVWKAVVGHPIAMRPMWGGLRKPKFAVPGTDVAGVVVEVGANVVGFQEDDEVFGESNRGFQWVNGGAYAEYAAVPEDALVTKPNSVSFEEAASVPTSGYIALLNLNGGEPIQPGHRVLINGAGGGVGSVALQLAKAHGAHVTGVDNAAKLAMVRQLGADHTIDYTQEDATQRGERYDFILDVASTLKPSEWKRMLTPTGTYVQIGHDHYGAVGSRLLGSLPRFFGVIARTPFDRRLPASGYSLSRQESMTALKEFMGAGTAYAHY